MDFDIYFLQTLNLWKIFLSSNLPSEDKHNPIQYSKDSIDQDLVQRLTFYQSLSKEMPPRHLHISSTSFQFDLKISTPLYQKPWYFRWCQKVQKVNVIHAPLIGFGKMGHFWFQSIFSGKFISALQKSGIGGGSIICFLGGMHLAFHPWKYSPHLGVGLAFLSFQLSSCCRRQRMEFAPSGGHSSSHQFAAKLHPMFAKSPHILFYI